MAKSTKSPSRKPKKKANGLGSKPLERNGSWSMLVTIGKKPNGKLIRKRVTAPTEKECVLRGRETLVEYGRGLILEATSVTFREYAQTWLKQHTGNLKASTTRGYENEMKIAYLFIGAKRLGEIKAVDIRMMIEGLNTYRTRTNKPLSTRTRRRVLARVKAILDDAVSIELIAKNPASSHKIRGQKIEKIGIALEPHHQALLLDTMAEMRIGFGIYLALVTGARRGELLALQRTRDIDIERRLIHIRESRDDTTHSTKTPEAVRSIPISPSTAEVIKSWYQRLEGEKAFAGRDYKDSGLLLIDELGKPLEKSVLNQALQRTVNKIRGEPPYYRKKPLKQPRVALDNTFPTIRLHDLRHTAATNWLSGVYGQRIPVEIVSRWLGHSSIAITMNTYAHVLKAITDSYAAAMPDLPPTFSKTQSRAQA